MGNQVVKHHAREQSPLHNNVGITRQEIAIDLNDDAQRLIRKSYAKATQSAYQSDARIFTSWCKTQKIEPATTSTANIINFLAMQASGKLSRWIWTDKIAKEGYLANGKPLAYASIYRRLNGVKFALKQLGRKFEESELESLSSIMKGIAAELGTDKRKVKGIRPSDLELVFSKMDLNDLVDLRDRAILMLIFAGAFRRSEIAGLLVHNIKKIGNQGVDVKLDKVKRKADGMTKSISSGNSLCPVRFLYEYMEAGNITSGILFRRSNRYRRLLNKPLSGDAINKMIKQRCKSAGLIGVYGGHSGRRGFVDASISAGKPINKVMEMTGHQSIQTIKDYFDEAERWKNNAGDGRV